MRALQGKNALIQESGHFMTVLRELPFSLVCCSKINICFGRRQEVMKQILKGVAVTTIVLIILIVISIICNVNGINSDSISNGAILAVCTMLIYQGATRKDKNKEDQDQK